MATDIIAQALALKAQPGLLQPPSFQGIRVFGGRTETAIGLNGSGNTWETAMELPARDALSIGSVFPIMMQSRNSASNASLQVDVKPIAALSDLDGSWGGSACYFGDGFTVGAQLFAPAVSYRRSYLFPDEAAITPVSRSDGGTRPLIAARTFVGNFQMMLLGKDTVDDYTNWATRSAGLVRFRANSTAGDRRTSTSGWVAGSTSPVVGFAYSHAGPIYNGMGIGDSIDEGRGTYVCEPPGLLAAETINAGAPKTWQSFSNMGWSGKPMVQVVQNFRDALAFGIVPDWVVFPCGSPNDVGALDAPITTAITDAMWVNFETMLGICARYRICPIVRSMLPVNYAVRQFGASDSLRLAHNARVAARCQAAGIPFFDFATLIAGATRPDGQQEILSGYTDDGIHPNSAGNALGATLLTPILRNLMKGYL